MQLERGTYRLPIYRYPLRLYNKSNHSFLTFIIGAKPFNSVIEVVVANEDKIQI